MVRLHSCSRGTWGKKFRQSSCYENISKKDRGKSYLVGAKVTEIARDGQEEAVGNPDYLRSQRIQQIRKIDLLLLQSIEPYKENYIPNSDE